MIGMTSVTFRKKSVGEVIDICKKAGIDCIEWGGDVHVPSGDIDNAKKVYEATTKAGLKVSSYGSYFWVGKNTMDEFKDVLATAEALHAKYIRVWLGDISSYKTSPEQVESYVEMLKEMATLAGEKDIIIASEFHPNTYNDGQSPCQEIMNKVASPYYKTYWQTVTYDNRDIVYLKGVKDDAVNIHVFSWNHWGVRYPLKKKAKLWKNIVEIAGKDRLYTIEFVKGDSDRAFLADVATLKSYLQ